METFSIVDKINVDKLNTKIAEFVYREGHEPYIFANKEAIYGLMEQDDIKQIYDEARAGNITEETFEKVIDIMAESDE